jgi:hypothetical protein
VRYNEVRKRDLGQPPSQRGVLRTKGTKDPLARLGVKPVPVSESAKRSTSGRIFMGLRTRRLRTEPRAPGQQTKTASAERLLIFTVREASGALPGVSQSPEAGVIS